MKLYFVRHGESTANLLREFWNTPGKHPLTEKGFEQARSLARELAGVKVDKIFSSPILRAVQTAKVLSEALRVPVQFTDALLEWSVGIYEGTTGPEGWALQASVMDDWSFHGKPDSKMPGGESLTEIHARFVPFIASLVKDWGAGAAPANLVLVSHGGLYTAILPYVLTNISVAFAREHGFPNTGYAIAETRPSGLVCTRWCGIAVSD